MRQTKPFQREWIVSILVMTFALTLAIGIGFLAGHYIPSASDDMSEICRNLPKKGPMADCIALRSAVATEQATLTAQWSLLIAVGSLCASSAALLGLISAFKQGQRTIGIATDANRIAMEYGRAQARAYVVVQSVEAKLSELGDLTAKVTFQNSGASPARRLRWLYNAHIVAVYGDNTQRGMMLGDEPDLERSHWRQDIPSADSWTSSPLGLRSQDGVAALLEKATFIAITIKVVADFQDVFGETHREIACFEGRVNPSERDASYTALHSAHDNALDDKTESPAA